MRIYRRQPIRWRLAGGSAVLTLVILAGFAVVVGIVTDRQILGQFNNQVAGGVDGLARQLEGHLKYSGGMLNCTNARVDLGDYARAERAQIRIFDPTGVLFCTQDNVRIRGAKAPPAVPNFDLPSRPGTYTQVGYRAVVETLPERGGNVLLLYALPISELNHTLARVRALLLLGVLGGTILALLAGLITARRATRPIVQLTDAAREIARTRDPSLRLPHPQADDEVAELARTLDSMLGALDSARGETEAMLERQREFVADASHELRTPLTSVLANLELLADELHGDQADTAQAALRSTQRMRRLVGDLLLLARADAARLQTRRPVDLGAILGDVAAELGPMTERHLLTLDPGPAPALGAADDLHRLVLNLLENALRHTPPGTHVRAESRLVDGEAVLVVQDDGPGIPPAIDRRMFERFVRGGRDGARAGGSGLGLAIVRAVAEAHHGSVAYERPPGGGSRFVIRLPAARVDQMTETGGAGAAL